MVWRAEIDEQGRWGRQVQPGLGWVLGRWQSGAGRQAGAAGDWLSFAGLGPRQVAVRAGKVGLAGRLAGLAGQVGQVGHARAARACLGLAVAWFSFARQVGQDGQAGQGRADWLVLQNELEFDQIALLVTSCYCGRHQTYQTKILKEMKGQR
ncbi:hypothetical protein BY996DRAFT_6545775 [Phakopsora pachyrhizi]|nr:hypothetical protein BY996DRAFT_6545775 [Phakopsora pachyrhizi]